MGTWEEKHFELGGLEAYLQQQACQAVGDLKVAKISQVSGEMSRVTVRGKPKLGFSIKMQVEVEKGTQFITIMFEDFNDYADHEVASLHPVRVRDRHAVQDRGPEEVRRDLPDAQGLPSYFQRNPLNTACL